ncbi:hypothetical protein A0H81_04583 [Grifola frondosa]|uniref:Uncharacterized protein n=1 Tax=Grifola frondosa TaxID=5627 RepID=A0A1C7MGA2_GRIFR|nr:hypothetical protein A0H81_04583 [Grifola frondosa]
MGVVILLFDLPIVFCLLAQPMHYLARRRSERDWEKHYDFILGTWLWMWLLNAASCAWITYAVYASSPGLWSDFTGLPHPKLAETSIFALAWVSFSITTLILVLCAIDACMDPEDLDARLLPAVHYFWPNGIEPCDIRIIAVAHGSPPEIYGGKKSLRTIKLLQPPSAYDGGKPMKTTYNQWSWQGTDEP